MRAVDATRRHMLRVLVLGIAAGVTRTALATDASTQEAPARAELHPLVAGVWVSGALSPVEVEQLKAQGFTSIVLVRPDGEEPGQASSASIEAAARSAGLGFSYAPIAGKDVPQAAVDAVTRELVRPDSTVLIACRSGRRATRAWALAEASRTGGLEAEAIESVAASAGQPVDDLREQIAARIATRIKLP